MSMIPFDKIKENCETIQMYQEDGNKNKQDDILKILCSDKTDEQKIFEMKQNFELEILLMKNLNLYRTRINLKFEKTYE